MSAEPRCNSQHKLAGMRCIRSKGHDGHCRYKAERMADGAIQFDEWRFNSKGEFKHVWYTAISPANAKAVSDECRT